MQKRFEVKIRGRIGPELGDQKSIRILNRVVEWTPNGSTYEMDQRHPEIIVATLGFQDSKAVSSPGFKPSEEKVEHGDDEFLSSHQATQYKVLTARGIFLSQDKTDIQFTVKELIRGTSSPTARDWKRLIRLGRYLVDKTPVVQYSN